MTFSVLIATYNRHEMLRGALHSLVDGTAEKPDQIVVVNAGDDRADDVVRDFIERSGNRTEIRLIKTINKNPATTRNAGLPSCTGDIIAITDDDAQVFPDWVMQMKRAHQEHPETGAVGGPVLGGNTESLAGKVADIITFPSWPEPRYVRTLPTVNISFKRKVVEGVGLLDETLFCGEDVDYNARVQKLGYKVYFDPSVKVFHHHRPTLKALLNQHYTYGRGYYRVRRKWPDMYCVYPHQLRRPKDILKALNFAGALLYQPILSAWRLGAWTDRLAALPVLFATELSWKGGMLVQAWQEHRDAERRVIAPVS